jgi:hypothetical protein
VGKGKQVGHRGLVRVRTGSFEAKRRFIQGVTSKRALDRPSHSSAVPW